MRKVRGLVPVVVCVCALLLVGSACAQVGISTGGVQGTILDPKGGTVASAKVSIISKATGRRYQCETNSAGSYNSAHWSQENM